MDVYSEDYIKHALKNVLSRLERKKVSIPIWRKFSASITSYYIDDNGCVIDFPNYILTLVSYTGFTISHTFYFKDIASCQNLERLLYRQICSMIR